MFRRNRPAIESFQKDIEEINMRVKLMVLIRNKELPVLKVDDSIDIKLPSPKKSSASPKKSPNKTQALQTPPSTPKQTSPKKSPHYMAPRKQNLFSPPPSPINQASPTKQKHSPYSPIGLSNR
jgi:hypothetical protein